MRYKLVEPRKFEDNQKVVLILCNVRARSSHHSQHQSV